MRLTIASMTLLFTTLVRRQGRYGVLSVAEAFSSPSRTLAFSTSKGQAISDSSLSNRRRRPRGSSETLYASLHPKEYKKYSEAREHLFRLKASTAEETTTTVDDVIFPRQGKNTEDEAPRMRFAPSPTGSLHVGGARTALYNWLLAKRGELDNIDGSAFVIRVEDTDVARSTKESEESVLADLKWLGLIWDEGPDMEGTTYGPYRQSERNEIYKKVADRLLAEGKAYRCFCTQEELEEMKVKQEAAGIPPRYDGTWRDADPELVQKMIDEGKEYTVRFKVPNGARVVIDDAVRGTVSWDAESTVGDFILLRSSGIPVYNFCVAVDDATMGITTVIRAEEHLTNTLRQGLILDALNAPRPRYAHCSLILGQDKQKLSKRHGATSCNQFRLDGYLPDAMVNYLSLLGWNDGTDNEIFTREELIESFELKRVVKSPSVFDMEKLNWVNSQHLKMMSIDEVTPLVEEQLGFLNMVTSNAVGSEAIRDFAFASTCLAKQMMETTRRAGTNALVVMDYPLPASFSDLEDNSEAKNMIMNGNFYNVGSKLVEAFEGNKLPQPDLTNILDAFIDPKDRNAPIVEDNQQGGGAYSYPAAYKAFMKEMAKEINVKGKNLFHPTRFALTGEMSGQDVTKQLSLVSMAEKNIEENVLNSDVVKVVGLQERIAKLKAFLETVPEEFRQPKQAKKESKKGEAKAEESSKATEAAVSKSDDAANQRANYDGPPITALDIRVGLITKAWNHPESDKLYCEEIDVGEEEPRQVASGLQGFYSDASDLVGRKVLVVCNLKERKLAGFPSHGMVLCSSNDEHTDVHIIAAPADAKIGERVKVPGWDYDSEDGQPYAENKVGKKKIFEKLAPYLKSDEYGTPGFLGVPFVSSGGVCSSPLGGGQVA